MFEVSRCCGSRCWCLGGVGGFVILGVGFGFTGHFKEEFSKLSRFVGLLDRC